MNINETIFEKREFQTSVKLKEYATWEEMNLKKELIKNIVNNGWKKPTPIQSRAVVPISQGRNIIYQSQNGTGKTATFSIGILQRLELKNKAVKVEMIVVSPTRELALQSEKTLKNLGASTRSCIGGNSLGDDVKALRVFDIQCVSGTPGRLLQLMKEHNIEASYIKSVVLDEADELLISNERQVMSILDMVKHAQIVVVTATVSTEVVQLSTVFLRNAVQLYVPKDDLMLSNINQYVVDVESEEYKFDALIDLYRSIPIEKAVIFVNSKSKGEWLDSQMRESEFSTSLVHGEQQMEVREKHMDKFTNGEARVLIATDVYSRGIDVRNITLVINFDIPTSADVYLHRIGRSGRYGRKGLAVTFCGGDSDSRKIAKLENYFSTKIPPLPSDLDSLFF